MPGLMIVASVASMLDASGFLSLTTLTPAAMDSSARAVTANDRTMAAKRESEDMTAPSNWREDVVCFHYTGAEVVVQAGRLHSEDAFPPKGGTTNKTSCIRARDAVTHDSCASSFAAPPTTRFLR